MTIFHLPARDGTLLAATLYPGRDDQQVCVIHAATAVPQRIYARFAAYLCARGPSVLTYDYRGIGASHPWGRSLRGYRASMWDWARLDAAGVHDWVHRQFPGARVLGIGHSFGGQLLGLLEPSHRPSRALLVSCPSGYWRVLHPSVRPRMLFYWHVACPLLTAGWGYLPLKRLKLGEDLPREAARQWRRWCLHPDYLFSELGPEDRRRYRAFPAPLRAYAFDDDPYCTPEGLRRMLDAYAGARPELRVVSPRALGIGRVGHLGFFKETLRDALWHEATDWLLDTGGSPAPSPARPRS